MFNKFLKIFVNEFIYGGHLLSIGASSIVAMALLVNNLNIDISILVIPYLISQIIYTYNHLYELNSDMLTNPERAEHILKSRNRIQLFLVIYVLLLLCIVTLTNLPTFLIVTLIVLGGITYTLYFKDFVAQYLAGLKNIYTSLFWAMLIFLVPSYYEISLTSGYFYLFIFTFLRWIVNSAFFDIKDIESDGERKLKTFAVIFGKSQTLNILHLFNLLSAIPILLGVYFSYLPKEALLLLFFVLYGVVYLSISKNITEKSLRNLSYIVVDGEYIFWPALIILGRYIL